MSEAKYNMMIDTHSHIYDEQFDEDRDETVSRALEAGVGKILLPAIDRESYEAMFALSRHYPELCRPMMGLHPTSVNENPRYKEDLQLVADYLKCPPEGIVFCGVGEIGLDLYWNRDYRAEQESALRYQIDLALQYGLPIVLHTREAWEEMCALLEAYRGTGLRGIVHSFSGTLEHYRFLREIGTFCFGIGGPITYKKSPVANFLSSMSLDDLVLETDSPYLSPVPYRGKRNESSRLVLICNRIAELYGVSPEEIAERTTRNAIRIFGDRIE